MNQNIQVSPTRQAAVQGLAIVGFIALIAAGMWLAVYSARFVPGTVSRLGSAAVALSSLFTPNKDAPGSVATTTNPVTIPFGNEPKATTTATSTAPATHPGTTASTGTRNPTPAAGTPTSTTRPIGTTGPVAPSGPADLTVTITAVGYMTTDNTSTFVASGTVPTGYRPAVKFTVRNAGGAATGAWRFTASIPTKTSYTYTSDYQQALNSGDSIDYVLGFDSAQSGTGQYITVIVNSDHTVVESNPSNDTASVSVNIK